jgi:hypothetical protein
MADPISIALQSSKSLYQAIKSFQSNRRAIRKLIKKLEALDVVLQSLHQKAANGNANLTGLELPLVRYGKVCRDFETVITKCTTHSGGSKTTFRDCEKLNYIGNDIIGFKNILTGYKSIISIALGNANL